MKAQDTSEGVVVPKELLGEAQEVEIHKSGNRIIIDLAITESPNDSDGEHSIWNLGSDPVDDDLKDGSVNLDKYLADEACGRSSSTPAS